jgi:hypothetical protein
MGADRSSAKRPWTSLYVDDLARDSIPGGRLADRPRVFGRQFEDGPDGAGWARA